MIRALRFLLFAFALTTAPACAAPRKPVTVINGQVSAFPSGDTLTVDNISTGAATTTAGVQAAVAAPSFAGGAHHVYHSFLMNGVSPATLYAAQAGGNYATEALTAGMVVPSTATIHQTTGIAAYVRSDRAQPSNGGDVAGYFQAGANANNSAVFGLNPLVYDTSGKTGQIIGNEFDFNVNAADTTVNGINLVIVGNTTLTGSRNAIIMQGAFSANSKWSNGLVVADGTVDFYALLVGATGTGNGVDSQPIAFSGRSSGGTLYRATIRGDQGGGLDLRPGVLGGSVAIQDQDGTNRFYVNSAGATLAKGSLTLAGQTFSQLPTCNSAAAGTIAYITDASAAPGSWHATVSAGGGSNKTFVQCLGSAWLAF